MDPIAHLLVIFFCLLLSAFFSGSETALLRLREDEVEREVREARSPAALAVQGLLRSTSRLLVTILLGNNIVNILAAATASAMAVYYLGEEVGILVATVSLTLVILVFCEVLPKALAASHPSGLAHLVALPLYLLHQALRPVHLAFDRLVDPFVERVTGAGVSDTGTGVSSEEVLRAAQRLREAPGPATPLGIIQAAAGAADTTAGQIMVPRTEIVAFPEETSPDGLLDTMVQERFTRVPIYRNSIDQVLGVVHLKDLVRQVRQGGTELNTILQPVLRVPVRKPILRLLSDMQRGFTHVAIVKDEFAVTQGLVTQEDILEELVGEIRDEFDREELLTIQGNAAGGFQAPGRVKVADFNRETGFDIPAEPGDTLSGLVFDALGHPARQDEEVSIGEYQLKVLGVSGPRVTQVGVKRQEGEAS